MSETPNTDEMETELLILPDGKVLVHNLTPTMARVMCELDPEDVLMRERAGPLASDDQKPPLP